MFRSINVPRALRVLGAGLLALSGCAPETDAFGVRASAGAGVPTSGAAAGTLATGGRGATAGFGTGTSAGMPGVVPSGAAGAGAAAPVAGVGAAGARAGGGAAGSAGMRSIAGSAAMGGRSAAGSGGAGPGAAGAAGGGAAANGETGRMVGMTAAHNAVRARLMNPVPNPALPPLSWSTALAATAQAYATKLAAGGDCLNLVHSNAPDLGENLAGYTGSMATPMGVVDGWAQEEKCYTFGIFMRGDKCDMNCTSQQNSSGCGHYTQVVWRATSQVGCGMATCGSGRNAGEVWVCNYKAPGNYVGEKVY